MRELSLNNCRVDRRYDICEHLGRGSYAEIFLARDILASEQSPHRSVVIKALNVFLQNDLDADLERTLIENFQNEAIALDRVRHPNILSRIGHGTSRDLRGTMFHYLVLEYLSGGDLQSLLRKQTIPLQQSLNYIEQICAGLGHAHRYSIIHRDIKPQNLLLTADRSTVKIADFGVARVTVSDSPITRVGTNIYAPPEHSPMSAGKTGTLAFAKLTPAADIYSLAKTVYTLLTGEAPRAFANEAIKDLPESVRNVEWSGELSRVLTRATDDDPRERQQSVEDFWTDLAGIREIAAQGQNVTVMELAATANVIVDTRISARIIDAPQPHVSRGYSPLAPARPSFDAKPVIVATSDISPPETNLPESEVLEIPETAVPAGKNRRAVRRFAAYALAFSLFTGLLYGTASYMRSGTIFPQILFKSPTGVANTDIYLRPTPNTDNDPIGLVTKNSKVRIVKTQNNWHQVDIVEQGRVRSGSLNATRGWLNGKYLEISDN